MKLHRLRDDDGTYDFRNADRLIAFAQENEMAMRGHTLVWDKSSPPEYKLALATETGWSVFEDQIRSVTSHFAGRIHSWDVVNEVLSDDEDARYGLKDSAILSALGPEFIKVAFDISSDIDPTSKKYLNDYFFYSSGAAARTKLRSALRTLEHLLRSDCPVDGLGIQGHLYLDRLLPRTERLQFFTEIDQLGLSIIVSELDIRGEPDRGWPPDGDKKAADAVEDFLSSILERGKLAAILCWGLSDRYSGLHERPSYKNTQQRPLPYDVDLQPKPMRQIISVALGNSLEPN